MIRNKSRKAATLVVALVVVSAVAISGIGPTPDRASPVGESEAVACGGVCIGAAALGTGAAIGYWLNDDGISREKADEMLEAEAKQQRAHLATLLISDAATSDQFITSADNTVENSRSVASLKAKARMAQLLNNGTTDTSTISTEVNETIDDYYSVKQYNLIQRFESAAAQVNYTRNVVNNDSRLDPVMDLTGASINSMEVKNHNPTLANGTVVKTFGLMFDTSTTVVRFSPIHNYKGETHNLIVKSISTSDSSVKDTTQTVYFDGSFDALYDRMGTVADDMNATYGPDFVDSVVAQYETGELNTSELISPEILANEWGTEYNQTGASVYRWANAVALGIDSPDLNETARMQTEYQRQPLTRMIRFNASLTGSSWSDSTPVNMTLTFDDDNETQVTYTLYNESGPQDPVVTIPVQDGPQYRDIDVTVTWDEGGELWDFSPGTTYTTANGELEMTQEVVQEVNVTEWGMIFSDSAPDGGWNASEPYDLANFSETVYWSRSKAALETVPESRHAPGVYPAAVNIQPRMINLAKVGAGSFTVTQIINDDGEIVSTVGVRDYNQQTTDASEFVNETQRILEIQKFIEANEPALTAGGGFFDWLPDSPFGKSFVLIAGGAVVLLALRD